MADSNQKQDDGKDGNNTMSSVMTGAAVGAGVAVAAVAGAMALDDKKNRDAVKNVLTDVKDQATGFVQEVKKEVKEEIGKMSDDMKGAV